LLNKSKNIIVIGGNAAGPAAAAKAKRVNPEANVELYEASNFISTGTCELPYLLSGEIKDYSEIVFFDEESFEREKGVKVYTNHLVEQIDRQNKRISIKNLKNNESVIKEYDKLILTTGSKPKKLPGLPSNLSNVFTLKSIPDFLKIHDYLTNFNVKTVGIIGAGYIGLEVAESFSNLGMEVYIWELENLPMPGAEEEIRVLINERLKSNGIGFSGSAKLHFGYDGNQLKYVKNASELIDVDLLLVSIGVSPNVDLAVSSGLKIGSNGGIIVNNKLQTSDLNIYAAGDNIELKNSVTNESQIIPIATLAHQFGHIAGENAAGGNSFINPVVRNIAVKIFEDVYTSVGLTTGEAKRQNRAFAEVIAFAKNIVHVMPGSRKNFGKLIFERRTGRILGASFLGGNEVTGFADFISGMITMKATVEDLTKINFNYTPPASPFINLLSVLARKALRKL